LSNDVKEDSQTVVLFFCLIIMASIQQHLAKVKVTLSETKITNDLFAYIRSIEKSLVRLNQNQIEFESKDIFDKPIGFYSQATENITNGKKKAGQPFTGRDSGNWLSGFRLVQKGDAFQFTSIDSKNRTILTSKHWLSNDVFGLSDEDLKAAIKFYFLPYFLKYFKDAL